jgi:ATP-dependent RNA helicase DDX5/DBP2
LYGRSHSFFVPADLKNAQRSARELVKIMSEAKQEIPAELQAIGGKGGKGFGGKGGKGFGGKGFGGKGKGKGGFKGGFGGKGRW